MEHAGFDGSVTPAGIRRNHDGGQTDCSLSSRQCRRDLGGTAALTPDGRPIVGADPDVRGLWYANRSRAATACSWPD